MNFIKIIFKTYFVVTVLSYLYLWLINSLFHSNEIRFIMLALLFGNMALTIAYVIGILLPFSFIFKHIIAANSFKMAMNRFLFYFSIVPLFFVTWAIILMVQNGNEGMQFSLLLFDLCGIIYTGFLYLLKYKTVS